MIQAHPRANWIRTPSLCQLWLETLLRAVAMLVVHVVPFLGMLRIRLSGECHTEVTPAGLPRTNRDPIRKPGLAAPDSEPIEGLSAAGRQRPRLSNAPAGGPARARQPRAGASRAVSSAAAQRRPGTPVPAFGGGGVGGGAGVGAGVGAFERVTRAKPGQPAPKPSLPEPLSHAPTAPAPSSPLPRP